MADAKPTFRFDDAGTIPPPGWIGRAARALFGYGSLYWVYQIVSFGDVGALTNLSVIGFTLFALQLIPYTVNIGFGIRLSFWPRYLQRWASQRPPIWVGNQPVKSLHHRSGTRSRY